MNESFSTQAGNFVSALQTGVDPRTGQFTVNFPLATLAGNNLLGPELSLGLSYSPLNGGNSGFGRGFSTGITRFSNATNLLELSNGEQFRVEPGSVSVRNQKLSNFRFTWTNGWDDAQGYTIFWKEGKKEYLTVREDGTTFVTTTIESPVGHTLKLSWEWSGQYPRLSQVDDELTTLCRVVYGTFTTMTVWPGSTDEYQMVFELSDSDTRLDAVRRQVSATEGLYWYFTYDAVGPGQSTLLLTGVDYPTGMKERVEYNQAEGLRFPEASGLNWLPAVVSHIIQPGGGQPETVKYYDYTVQNFLGYNSNFGYWSSDSDYLYTTLTDYTYGSTETISDGNDAIITTRIYNNYHLQVSEETVRQGCTYRTDFTYYAEKDVFIDGQPPQFQLPRAKKETWTWNGTGKSRSQTTLTEFDEHGNPLREVAPDGTETLTTWYAAEGEDGCPPEPDGFVRFIKSQTVVPGQTIYDAPVMYTTFTYTLLGGNDLHVVQAGLSDHADDVLLSDRVFTYNDTAGEEYGRVTAITDTKYTDGAASVSFISRQDFLTTVAAGIMSQTVVFTGHDGLTATTVRRQSALSSRLLSETDAQSVTTDYSYDRTGRILTRTLAPGTSYQNTTTWTYTIESDGPVSTETDASGNQIKIRFDGAGREISHMRYDTDNTGQWYEIATTTYNTFGEASAGSGSDWLTGDASERYIINTSVTYDGWGGTSVRTFSDGTEELQVSDPVALTRTWYSAGQAGTVRQETDRRTTQLDNVSQLPVTESRTDVTSGQNKGVRTFGWDGAGRLRQETDELNHSTLYTYDAYNRVLTQTLPDGSVVTRTYAPHLTGDQVTSISMTGPSADGSIQVWQVGTQEYDSLGRVIRRTVGGRESRYTYDGSAPVPSLVIPASGDPVRRAWIAELGNALSNTIGDGVTQAFAYNPVTAALLTAEENDSTVNSNIWSTSGNLQKETFTRDGSDLEASHTWTLSGAPVTYTDITGKQTAYTRDEFSRVTDITDEDLSVTLHYDLLGRLTRQVVAGSSSQETLITQLEYDGSGREITRTITDSRSGTVLEMTQAWLDNDLLASRTLKQDGVSVRYEVYGYDTRNRLTSYDVSGSSLPPDAYGQDLAGQRYCYDALNNLTQVITTLSDGSQDTAIYYFENTNDPTQLTSVTHTHEAYPESIPLEYDANGRMTRDEAGRTLSYDVTGRLTGVSGESIPGGSYGYDALNRLVSQTVSEGDERRLYYRADELVNEVLVQQGRTTRLVKQGHSSLGVNDGNNVILTAGDRHDSLLWSHNGAQDEGRLHGWSPWGNGRSEELLPGFNGERADPVSGTYHLGNGYRAYNPVLMRFNCPDSLSPFGAGGINPYAYCAGDPVNNTDPSGHVSTAGWVGIGLGIAGILLSVVTGGASIAAAGGIAAAWAAASATTLVVGGIGLAADAAAIASGALEEDEPEISGVLGWVSMATGLAGMVAGIGKSGLKSVISSAKQREHVVLGGTMKNLDSLGQDFYLFDDTYKKAKRLNLVAHGVLENDGTARVARSAEKNMNPSDIFSIINKRKNLQEYSNIRTIMCYSGNGGEHAFGQRLATLTGIPVKSYRGTVTGNYEVGDLNKILLETAVKFGDDGLEYMQAAFAQRRTFEIYKTNPHDFFSFERWRWNFDPVKFRP